MAKPAQYEKHITQALVINEAGMSAMQLAVQLTQKLGRTVYQTDLNDEILRMKKAGILLVDLSNPVYNTREDGSKSRKSSQRLVHRIHRRADHKYE